MLTRLALLLALTLAPVIHSAPVAAAGGPLPRLFGDSPASAAPLAAVESRFAIRARVVEPDLALLERLASETIETNSRAHFTLDLFPGLEVEAEVLTAERRSSGGTTVFARIVDQDFGSAVFTIEAGVLTASVDFAGHNFAVEAKANRRYRLAQLDARQFPPELAPVQIQGAAPSTTDIVSAFGLDVPADSGRLIDVMILWTQAAENAAGGASTMQSLAQNAIDNANLAYINSGIAQRLRLVHSTKVAYTERTSCAAGDAFSCALSDLSGKSDGHIDDIHTLRNTYGVDLVSLLIEDSAYCGLAYLPGTISSGNEGLGFSIVAQACAVGNKSFAHELGHNMGANHDLGSSSGSGPFPYNHGYSSPNGNWRTVMAYPGTCPVAGPCSRITFFSNPNVLYSDGVAMGDASVRNNALVLNKTAKAVASYRATTTPPGPQPAYFADVPLGHPSFGYVQFMAQAAYTNGCAAGLYCPTANVTRRHMAAFLERVKKSAVFAPPAAVGLFSDVPTGSLFAGYIEALYADGITNGCGVGLYCPDAEVTRAQMAKFILKAKCGGAYTPGTGAATSPFADVLTSDPFYPWIYKLYTLGITNGCGPTTFCPTAPVTRAQMATFLERAYPFGHPSDTCTP